MVPINVCLPSGLVIEVRYCTFQGDNPGLPYFTCYYLFSIFLYSIECKTLQFCQNIPVYLSIDGPC